MALTTATACALCAILGLLAVPAGAAPVLEGAAGTATGAVADVGPSAGSITGSASREPASSAPAPASSVTAPSGSGSSDSAGPALLDSVASQQLPVAPDSGASPSPATGPSSGPSVTEQPARQATELVSDIAGGGPSGPAPSILAIADRGLEQVASTVADSGSGPVDSGKVVDTVGGIVDGGGSVDPGIVVNTVGGIVDGGGAATLTLHGDNGSLKVGVPETSSPGPPSASGPPPSAPSSTGPGYPTGLITADPVPPAIQGNQPTQAGSGAGPGARSPVMGTSTAATMTFGASRSIAGPGTPAVPNPEPSPGTPGGALGAGGFSMSGTFFTGFATLLVMLSVAFGRFSRRLDAVPAAWRPLPFLALLERPG